MYTYAVPKTTSSLEPMGIEPILPDCKSRILPIKLRSGLPANL